MILRRLRDWVWARIVRRLNREREQSDLPPCDFERLSYEIRPCDVLLVEGRSRVGDVIKYVTLSPWTHAALYIGRLHDVDDPAMRERIRYHYNAAADEQLVIEALLGEGTIVAPLARYRGEHVRICRPRDIARGDAQQVINYCARHLGHEYDVRQLLDLARFMLPYGLLPRRWRSSLFAHHPGSSTRTVCSTLLARAFAFVRFPVLPVLRTDSAGAIRLHKRNFKLFVPGDFDYSPYFDVIKYPLMSFDDLSAYRRMPWTADVEQDGPPEPVPDEQPVIRGDTAPSTRPEGEADPTTDPDLSAAPGHTGTSTPASR